MSEVVTLVVSVILMLAVVGASVQWAVRAERRRERTEDPHAGDH